jgi:hypothetical protein
MPCAAPRIVGNTGGRRAETAGLRRMLHLPPGIVHVILFSNR